MPNRGHPLFDKRWCGRRDIIVDILLVDDNPDDRALVRRGVQQSIGDVHIREAGTAAELDSALAATEPDVAVIDYSLGWADGLEVFRRIRRVHPDCGVVMFTGSLGEEGAVDVLRAGIDDYFLKDPSRVPRLVAALQGLARRVEDRRARRRAEARNVALRRAATVGMITCRPDGAMTAANPAALRMLGLEEDGGAVAANLLDMLSAPALRDLWSGQGGVAIKGLEVAFGEDRAALLDAHSAPGADGEVECVLTEVTALRNAVRRSETLLREVYHRVYNNLQVMDALLLLQAGKHSDPAVKEGFHDVSQRLRTLALVQQRLHRGDDFEGIDVAAYLRDLADAAAAVRVRPEVAVTVESAPELSLPIDTAIPLGLLATELVTNAYKHAFPEGRAGHIRIFAARTEEGGFTLTVADDGIGAPADIYQARKGAGIGARVVPQLAAQVRATLTVSVSAGTTVRVDVPPNGESA